MATDDAIPWISTGLNARRPPASSGPTATRPDGVPIADGADNQQISDRLVISPKTVSNYISSIFNKLQVADRANAIIKARRAGLGTDA